MVFISTAFLFLSLYLTTMTVGNLIVMFVAKEGGMSGVVVAAACFSWSLFYLSVNL